MKLVKFLDSSAQIKDLYMQFDKCSGYVLGKIPFQVKVVFSLVWYRISLISWP